MSANQRSKIVRRLFGALFVLFVLGLVVVAAMPKPVPVDVETVAVGAMEITIDEDGRTEVIDRHTLSAPLSGNLARVELDPGEQVREEKTLARILPMSAPLLDERTRAQAEARVAGALASQRQARASINRLQAAAEYAQTNLARHESLLSSGGASQATLDRVRLEERSSRDELESARFGVRVADYEVRMARAALGRISAGEEGEALEVPSPINGQVLRVLQESEGVVQAGQPLLQIGDPSHLEVIVDVLTADAVRIQPGAPVRLERWGGESALAGRVRRVDPSAFTKVSALGVEEQRVNVVIDIESPREEWESLGDGFRVEARIQIWHDDETLRVPASAIFRHRFDEGTAWATFVLVGELAELRRVEIGRQNGLEAEVIEGVREGESVIVHPNDDVEDGVSVRVR